MKSPYKFWVIPLFFVGISLLKCSDIPNGFNLYVPNGFPEPEIPKDNQLNLKRIALGKKLFYDTQLSKDSSLSCASCHIQAHAFSDTQAVSAGFHGRRGFRNAPTLANVAYKDAFFKDGGVPTLELQLMAPIQDSFEMNINYRELLERMKNAYKKESKEAYNRPFDGFVLSRALASFQRTLISGNSKFDKVKRGEASFTPSEKRGEKLFFSDKTNCSGCHSGFNFTNNTYQNIGLKSHYTDSGRMRVTGEEIDRNKFMVPTLRNIEVTFPYMHDGSLKTLDDVIEFFNSGGFPSETSSSLIKPLNLSKQEKKDLIQFLKTLTDKEFLNNKSFQP